MCSLGISVQTMRLCQVFGPPEAKRNGKAAGLQFVPLLRVPRSAGCGAGRRGTCRSPLEDSAVIGTGLGKLTLQIYDPRQAINVTFAPAPRTEPNRAK